MWLHSGFRLLPEGRFTILRVIYTYIVFVGGCLLFAAPSIHHTIEIVREIFALQRGLPAQSLGTLIGLSILGYLLNAPQYYDRPKEWLQRHGSVKAGLVVVLTFLLGYMVNLYGDVTGSFIYFNF